MKTYGMQRLKSCAIKNHKQRGAAGGMVPSQELLYSILHWSGGDGWANRVGRNAVDRVFNATGSTRLSWPRGDCSAI